MRAYSANGRQRSVKRMASVERVLQAHVPELDLGEGTVAAGGIGLAGGVEIGMHGGPGRAPGGRAGIS